MLLTSLQFCLQSKPQYVNCILNGYEEFKIFPEGLKANEN